MFRYKEDAAKIDGHLKTFQALQSGLFSKMPQAPSEPQPGREQRVKEIKQWLANQAQVAR